MPRRPPLRNSQLVKIHFRLDEVDSGSETIWAQETHPGHFRLENSPFFAFNVSYQDVVLAKPVGAELVFVETIRRSGHSTYRLIPVAERGARFDAAWRPLQQLGCTFEEGPDGLLAV